MSTRLHNAAIVEHVNAVGVGDRPQPVSDHDNGTAVGKSSKALLDQCLIVGVGSRGSLIQDEMGRSAISARAMEIR